MPELVRLSDVAIACEQRGSGPPLLFVHAYPLCGRLWDRQVSAFAADYRTIVPDLRGFGDSGVPRDPESVEIADYADDLFAMLDALGVDEPVVFAGVSMGGYIGWEFWRRHPDKCRALFLACTNPHADSAAATARRHEIAAAVLADGTDAIADVPKSLLGRTTRTERPELVTQLERWIAASDPVGIAAAQFAMSKRADFADAIATLDCPAGFVAGEEDTFTKADAIAKWVATIPGASLTVVPQVGHLPMLEAPDAYNAALRAFLDRLDADANDRSDAA